MATFNVFMKVESVEEFFDGDGLLVGKALNLGLIENIYKEQDRVMMSIPSSIATDELRKLYEGKFVIIKTDRIKYPKATQTAEKGWKSDNRITLHGVVAGVWEPSHVKMILDPSFPEKFRKATDEGIFNQS